MKKILTHDGANILDKQVYPVQAVNALAGN